MKKLPYVSFLHQELEELYDTPPEKLFFLAIYSLVLVQVYLVIIFAVISVTPHSVNSLSLLRLFNSNNSIAINADAKDSHVLSGSTNSKIVYTSDEDGDHDIYIMDPDGENRIKLTQNLDSDQGAVWSPDGNKIAFKSDRDGDFEIYVMNYDGSNVIQITNNTAHDQGISWSPDGTKLSFINDSDGDMEVYTIDLDGLVLRKITNNDVRDSHTSWSPDGAKIAFACDRGGDLDVCLVYLVDLTEQNLTSDSTADDATPAWSPTGDRIVFRSKRSGNNDIFVMDANGSNATQLTTHPADDVGAVWSPDATKIAFSSDRNENSDIYIMDSDGGNQINITSSMSAEDDIDWNTTNFVITPTPTLSPTIPITPEPTPPGPPIDGPAYYVGPNGNDSNPGTRERPWKTFRKANDTIQEGDTVVALDGIYYEYVSIKVPGTTWIAENKHKAIIDGTFSPTLLNGVWRNVVSAWDNTCEKKGISQWKALIITGQNDVTVDGFMLRNSCGRGILVGGEAQNTIIKNTWTDWTLSAGLYVGADTKGFQFINNILTRNSFGDVYRMYKERKYSVNITIHMSGEDMIFKGNIVAWGRGEIAMTGARNLLVDCNVIVGNKNNFYPGWAQGVIFSNNLVYAPDSEITDGTHWEKWWEPEGHNWHMSTRNEHDPRWSRYADGLHDIAYYNNLIINNEIGFDGYHRPGDTIYSTNTTQVYFGHNTVVAGPGTKKIFNAGFNAVGGYDSKITGIFESNVFDNSKNRDAWIDMRTSGNDDVTWRNNVLPTDARDSVRGQGDVYTNDPGLVNVAKTLDFRPPAIGAATLDISQLLSAVNITDYLLKPNSPAIEAGSVGANISDTTVPELARTQDFYRFARTEKPDIGAFELGSTGETCVDIPPSPTITPPFIPPIYCEEPPAPPGPPPAPVGCGELSEVGLVDVTCPQYGADPTCAKDSTQAIRNAMKDAQDHNMVTFFPTGTYCVSDTIELIKVHGDKGEDGNAHEMVGSTLGARPIIRLMASSPGFNNPNDPKPVILMYTIRGKLKNDGSGEIGAVNNANGFMQSIRNLDFEIEEGNPGAVAVNHSGAQNNSMQNISVRMKSGYAGFAGFVGDNSAISNIEVVGGKYGITTGIVEDSVKWPTLTNVRLYDQTEAAIYRFAPTNWMISGLHIRKNQAPAIVADGGSSTSGNFTILDGKIEFEQQSNAPVVQNSGEKAVTFINTYFKNASNLVDNHAPAGFGGADWKKVTEYAVTGGGVNIINGDTSGNTYAPAAQAATPPENLVSKHGANPADYPSPDVILGLIKAGDRTVANVWDYGIFPTVNGFDVPKYGVGNHTNPDITDKLQNLINSGVEMIFFPKGKYVVSRTIEMGENTHFIGVANQLSGLAQSDNWRPTASNPMTLIRTPDSATASPKISYFRTLWRTDIPYDHFVAIHIRSGKTVFFDTYFRMALSQRTTDLAANRRILMTGNAGGKFYGLNMGGNEPRNQHKDYRHLLIDGTFNPIVIYGPNPEDHDFYGKVGGWGIEIRNARNVAIYGSKQENHNTILIQNSSNIATLSLSNYDNINFLNTNNAVASSYPKFYDGSTLLREIYQGQTTNQAKNKEIALFKRGQVDYTALDPNIDGGDSPPDIPPPIIIPPPSDINCVATAVGGLSTQPCSIYKEFKIVNTGSNRAWRVTGEDAAAADAQKFLPNPILDISVDDLENAIRAEVMLDMWGGHDGTQNKRVRINGNEWINIPAPRFALPPDNPATGVNESDPMRYLYQMNPIMDIPLAQLKQGVNTIEGNANRCGNGSCIGWPQWGMNAVMIRIYYDPAVKAGPKGQIVFPSPNATINDYQSIHVAATSEVGVERIDVLGNYYGYDENGDGFYNDWHHGYFVSEKGSSDPSLFDISGHIGTTNSNPGSVRWDTTWIPDQSEKAVQLIARVKDKNGYWTVTTPINGLTLFRQEPLVEFFEPNKASIRPAFGVRNGQTKSSTVTLPADFVTEKISQAIAHIRTWNGIQHGGSDPHGTFVLNSSYTGIIGGKNHHYAYTTPEISDLTSLQANENTFSFSSETIHHHNEILWPGPGISLRYGGELLCPPLTPVPPVPSTSAVPTLFPDPLTGIILEPIRRNDGIIIFTFGNAAPKNGATLGNMNVYIDVSEGSGVNSEDLAMLEANVGNQIWLEGKIAEGETPTGEFERYIVTTMDRIAYAPPAGFVGGIEINWNMIIPITAAILILAGIGVTISRRV